MSVPGFRDDFAGRRRIKQAINPTLIMVRPIEPGSGTVVVVGVPVKVIVAEKFSNTNPVDASSARTV